MSRLIDLGHPIHDGMPAYPGLPSPRVSALLTHEESRPRYDHRAEFALTMLEMAGNTGTYLDSPWHRHPDRCDIAGIPLDRVADLPGVVVDAVTGPGRAVDIRPPSEAIGGGAVLIRTNWSRHWGSTRYWHEGPYLGVDAIDRLLGLEPGLVGVDFANVDDPGDPRRPAHTRLLEAGILIVEHMCNLDALPEHGFRLHCAPLIVAGAASISVRPYARLDDGS